jgi:methyl-accepting chemotaxis protein/methyl-accepting chemotaxis protein-1 (serine sensor receptor)
MLRRNRSFNGETFMLFKSATSRNIFAVAAAGVVTTIAAAGVLFTVSYETIRSQALSQMGLMATENALDIEKRMEKGKQIVHSLETTVSVMKVANHADRDHADQLMKTLLEDNAMALGVWTGWDENAFDGKDKDFAGTKGHDASGRYMPYWVRSGDTIIKEVLVDYTVPGAGDYYIQPHDSQKMVIIEPYVYPIDGKPVLMTSITQPIMLDGKAVGVAGIDLSLNDLGKELSALKPMGDGVVGLVTAAGNIVSHPDSALNGKTLKDAAGETEGWADLIANPGSPRAIHSVDGDTHYAVAVPVDMTPDNKWFAIVSVPEKTVFAKLDEMVWISGLIIAAAALLLGLAGWLIARRFVGRIENVIGQTLDIANGKLDVVLTDREKKDELGDLSRSLGILLDGNRRRIELEHETERSRRTQESERSERARLAQEQEEEIRFAVDELANGLNRLSNGDMTVRLGRPFTGALEAIRADFNNSVEKLEAAMISFSENAKTIQTGAQEIRSAADDLSRRTEQQAASVEETAAALEEITTSVKDSTHRAEEAGQLVSRTKEGAEKSGEVVRNAVSAMSAIEQSSESISNIIGVIDEIAFQTNLLALNAGVEAARAGDAGKGFAVVAQEVRELAQRSANAAKEIKSLITSSGEQVKRGVTLVGETGKALETIVSEVQDINRNVQAIVQAAREQSTGLQEINAAVNQMDQATQKNAAMVEESNAASHTLATEVTALSGRLAQFNLGGQAQPRMAAPMTSTINPPPSRPAPAAPAPAAPRTFTPRPRVAPVSEKARPAPSPARALGNKLAAAFTSKPVPSAASSNGDWEEF